MAITPPKSPAPTIPTLKIEVLPSSHLLDPSQKTTLRNLCRLINDSFSAHGHPKDNGDATPDALFLRKRLVYDEELPGALGPEALTAICTDEMAMNDGDGEVDGGTSNGTMVIQHQRPSVRGKIVATGSLKLWRGKVVDLARSMQEAANVQVQAQTQIQTQIQHAKNGHLTPTHPPPGLSNDALALAEQTLAKTNADSTTWNWEVKLCASLNTPHYRGRGLMTRCVDALVAELKRQQAVIRESGDDARGTLPIKLWITSLEGTGNTEYWVRRGFVKVGESEVAPRGTWESTRDIGIATLAKMVE